MNKRTHKKGIKYLLLGILGLIFFDFLKKKNKIDIKENLENFLKKEESEFNKYRKQKEKINKYFHNSFNIFKNYFIPGDHNDHRPKILHAKSLAWLVIILTISKILLGAYVFFIFPYTAKMDEHTISEIYRLVNEVRISQNLSPLNLDPDLSNFAELKARDMAEKNYFDHTSPDGRKPWDFIDRSAYKYMLVGENLAMSFNTAASAHDALMRSPSHKKNIMNEKYTDIGLAMATAEIDGKTRNVLVQFFSVKARPLNIAANTNTNVAGQTPEIQNSDPKKEETSPKIEAIEEKTITAQTIPIEVLAQKSEPINKTNITKGPKESIKTETEAESGTTFATETTKKNDSMDTKNQSPELLSEFTSFDVSVPAIINTKFNSLNTEPTYIKNNHNEAIIFTNNKIDIINYILFAVISLLLLVLIINIIFRLEVNHKPIIIQTLVAVLLIGGLAAIKFEYFSNLLPEIVLL